MQMFSFGDHLHEMSNPVFWEKNKKNITNSICLISWEMEKVKNKNRLSRETILHETSNPVFLKKYF